MKKILSLVFVLLIAILFTGVVKSQDNPVAVITPEWDSICPGLPVVFFDGSYDPNGHTIITWEWDFGDGNTSSEMHPTHIFTTQGYYSVLLTVYNDVGGSNITQIPFHVYNNNIFPYLNDISCFGQCDGLIYPSTELGSPFQYYSWIGPNGYTNDSPEAFNLCAGEYYVTVSEDNGCSAQQSFSLFEPLEMTVEIISSECVDSTGIGWITANVTGGTPPYLYIWNNGAMGNHLSNLMPGVYQLTVSDNNGCTAFANASLSDQLCPVNLMGTVFEDNNSDCSFVENEGLSNILVRAMPGPYYSYTNSDGLFKFYLNEGTYTLDVVGLSVHDVICPVEGFQEVVITDVFDTIENVDLGIEPNTMCSLLDVNITTGNIRPCFNTTVFVNYSNFGSVLAENATIEVTLEDMLSYNSSTIPYLFVDNSTYTFEIGDVAPFGSGSFSISTYTTCDLDLLGETACVSAIISPQTDCTTDFGEWDHSSVSVEGECVDDLEACFTITNTGDFGGGDMTNEQEYRIFANDTLVHIGSFQLVGGDVFDICWPTQGRAIRLEADQHPEHPGNSHPQETIEGCGDLIGSSLGFITNNSYDDEDIFVDIHCIEVTGSYDPNEKLVHPSGITANNYIDDDIILTYQINFQNTGTDTAFTVIITDTISNVHDMATFQNGVSSHPCELEITGQGILKWTFNNILLPDSTTNEPASHGFVTYTIKPIAMTEEDYGTAIENSAAIFFDYNPPIITNTTNLTFWNLPIILLVEIPLISAEGDIKIFPNPVIDKISIESTEKLKHIAIFDASGKIILSEMNQEYTTDIDVSFLKPGLFFIKTSNIEGREQIFRFIKN